MKYIVVYDEDSEWDMTLCSCDSWETVKEDDTHEENKHDIRFIRPAIFINHNAAMGMSGTILSGSDTWEIYVNMDVPVKEFNNIKEAATYYFNLLIEEGYGYDEHNFINDFFNDYAEEAKYKNTSSKFILLSYLLDAMGK